MSVANAVCNTFKQEILMGVHEPSDVYKIALYDGSTSVDKNTTHYTIVGEVVGVGYTAGGAILSGYNLVIDGDAVILDWSTDPTWINSTITAQGALIYNASKSNKAVCALSFGSEKSSISGMFRIIFPAATETTGLVVIK